MAINGIEAGGSVLRKLGLMHKKLPHSENSAELALPKGSINIPGIKARGLNNREMGERLISMKKRGLNIGLARDVIEEAEVFKGSEVVDLIGLSHRAIRFFDYANVGGMLRRPLKFGDRIFAEQFLDLAEKVVEKEIQMKEGDLFIAVMKPVVVHSIFKSVGDPFVLSLECYEQKLWLNRRYTRPDGLGHPGVWYVVSPRK